MHANELRTVRRPATSLVSLGLVTGQRRVIQLNLPVQDLKKGLFSHRYPHEPVHLWEKVCVACVFGREQVNPFTL